MKDNDVRPTSFDDYIGQTATIAVCRRAVSAARHNGRACGHMLVSGLPGCGKTSLAQIIATEMGVKLHVSVCTAIEHKGELTGMLTSLGANDVLLLDEIHALDKKMQEMLYTTMEDGVVDLPAGRKTIRIPLQPFTLIGATTRGHLLTGPLRDRFLYKFNLVHYAPEELSLIAFRTAKRIGVAMHEGAADEIAYRSRGTPRVANNLVKCVRDYAQSCAVSYVDGGIAAAALDMLGLDSIGLDKQDRTYLQLLVESGKPVGLDAIAVQMGVEKGVIEGVIEPHLLEQKLVQRTGAGRVATALAIGHLQATPEDTRPEHDPLDTEHLS